MASFKLAAAALLALGTSTAFVPSFVPKSIQQSAIQTNALYSAANNHNNNNAARAVSSSSLQMVVSDPTEVGGGRGGMFTQSNAENRRIVPEDVRDRPTMKIVYVVLESQYQSSMTAAAKRINAGSDNMAVECVG